MQVTFIFRASFAISQGVWNSGASRRPRSLESSNFHSHLTSAPIAGTGANYIFFLEDHSNTRVGVVQAIQGIFIPLASFPGGYFADRFRRDSVLKFFGGSGFGPPY